MALPAIEKCVLFLLIVFSIYTGYGFRIREGSPSASTEQPHGVCDSAIGKCADKTDLNSNLAYKKYQSLGLRGKVAKSQQLPVENEDRVFGRIEKVSTVKVIHGARRFKVSRIETNTSQEKNDDKKGEDSDLNLSEDTELERDNTEEIKAEPDKSSDLSEEESARDDDRVKSEIEENNNEDEEEGSKGVESDNDDKMDEEKKIGLKKFPKMEENKENIKQVVATKVNEKDDRDDNDAENNDNDKKKNDNSNEEKDENNDFEDEKKQVTRKLEKVRLADKEKGKLIEIRNIKSGSIINQSSEAQIIKHKLKETAIPNPVLNLETEKPKPKIMEDSKKQAYTSEKEHKPKIDTNKSESKLLVKEDKGESVSQKEDAAKSVPEPSSRKEKESKTTRRVKQPLTNKEKQIESEKKSPESKKSKKQREVSMTLTQLNGVLLHVPTFVPNFTAAEDPICQQHGKIFLRQLRGYKLWALQMLDSGGKIPSGLLRGNVNQLGDFDQCLGINTRVKVEDKTVKVQGKYCLASLDLYATHTEMKLPVNLMQSRGFIRGTMRDPGHFIPRFTTVNWALCIPAACSAADARKFMAAALQPYNMTSGIKFSIDVDAEMCYVKQKPQHYSKETIGVLYLYATILCLVVVATLRDYISSVQEKGNYSERIIMSFSLKRTVKFLFREYRPGTGEITCIHGIRSLATMALYAAHKLIPLSRMPYANRVSVTEVANNPISSVLRVSLVYTDSFLLLSGVLTAYNMTKELQTRGDIRWCCRFMARFIRLTPSLVAVIFWYAFVMEHIGNGPQWNSVIKSNADICKQNAWTNLLYIQNFFPFEEMCATHTHQLALDMQLSLIVPMLVFFFEIKPIIGILLTFFLLQLSATLRYLATVNNNLSLVIFHGMTVRHLYKTANLTYVLPLHRATPYLFGVGLGVLLNYTGKNVKLHKIFLILGWFFASGLGLWSLFSPWKYARRDFTYDVEDAAYYAVISPVFSALALSWVIFTCFTGHGGLVNKLLCNYWLVVFSRISYAIYLTQFAVFFYNVGTTRYSSEFQIHKSIDLYEATSVIAISIIVTLLFDIPLQEVKNVIMECTDGLSAANTVDETLKDDSEKNVEKVTLRDRKETEVDNSREYDTYEEEEPKRWNWQKGTFKELIPRQTKDNSERQSDATPRLKRQDARRQSLIRMDNTDRYGAPWDLVDEDEASRRSRSSHRTLMNKSEAREDNVSTDKSSQARNNVSSRDTDDHIPGMIRQDRCLLRSLRREDVPSFEIIRDKSEENRNNSRSSKSLSRHEESILLSSESEDDRMRPKSVKRIQEPRVSDDEDWEQELRIRKRSFREKNIPQNQEEALDDEWNSTRRRSSAEGKIALLREPVGKEMTFWTVSKVSRSGFSQEHSSFSDTTSDEEGSWEQSNRRSLTSESQLTSVEDDENVAVYDFVLKKDSRRTSVQDLSRLSQEEEEEVEPGWNMVKGQDVESMKTTTGLFKRQSIIKSQASEEDPEYLLPERPKLVEQEQEHPFKKAWQEQKSRSEEDSYVVKETKESKEIKDTKEMKDTDTKETKQHSGDQNEGGQDREIDHFIDDGTAHTWQRESGDSENSNSKSSTEEQKFNWPDEEEQFENYKLRRKSEDVNWVWDQEET